MTEYLSDESKALAAEVSACDSTDTRPVVAPARDVWACRAETAAAYHAHGVCGGVDAGCRTCAHIAGVRFA